MEKELTKTGVVLMTYGSATTAEGVPAYLAHIYGGEVPEERTAEFKRRYDAIGRSPLIDITAAQAHALEESLGEGYTVRSGMRHSDPFIKDAVGELKAAGATRLVGLILSPQFSSFIMDGYHAAFRAAATEAGYTESAVTIVGPWPTEPPFVEFLASSIDAALSKLGTLPVLFTTHSLPRRVVEQDPSYLEQLSQTIDAVRAKLTQPLPQWYAAYQSAGHTPEPWLTPDVVDIVRELKTDGEEQVLIVPIQFLADHLEVLYDLDIATREQCEALGVAYHRIELPNTGPCFIGALKGLVQKV